MTGVIVILAIAAFIALLLSLKAVIVVSYAEDVAVVLRIGAIPIRITPRKKKKVKLSAYSERKRKKKEAEERKKLEKKRQKKADKRKKEKTKPKKESKKSLKETINLVCALLKVAVGRFAKHLRIRVAKLHVSVATGDAASTAVAYGAIVQSASYLAALLDRANKLDAPAKADVMICADYLSEKTHADVEIGFSLRLWQMLDVLLRTGITLIKKL